MYIVHYFILLRFNPFDLRVLIERDGDLAIDKDVATDKLLN